MLMAWCCMICLEDSSLSEELKSVEIYVPNHCVRWMTYNKTGLLRSAVGKTHVLQSRLVMNYATSYFPLIVLGYP